MFVAAVCIVFLVKLKWPKKKSVHETTTAFFVSKSFNNTRKPAFAHFGEDEKNHLT